MGGVVPAKAGDLKWREEEVFHGQERRDIGEFPECFAFAEFMDFIFDNIILFVMAAAGLVQWWRSTQEAKAEEKEQEANRREAQSYEEFAEEVERSIPRPAVPPPLPGEGARPMPGVERSPVPDLRRSGRKVEAPPLPEMSGELQRQEAIAEQLRDLRRAKKDSRPAFENRRKAKVESSGGIGLKARLKNKRELKDAFVLKEILEKPLGLR